MAKSATSLSRILQLFACGKEKPPLGGFSLNPSPFLASVRGVGYAIVSPFGVVFTRSSFLVRRTLLCVGVTLGVVRIVGHRQYAWARPLSGSALHTAWVVSANHEESVAHGCIVCKEVSHGKTTTFTSELHAQATQARTTACTVRTRPGRTRAHQARPRSQTASVIFVQPTWPLPHSQGGRPCCLR